ncbi:MAG: NifU family protein [Chloroflexota bacterium]|nr:NifU family protein [Chloroflexota bacterium]
MAATPQGALAPPDNLADLGEWIDGLIQDFAAHPDEGVRERVFALLDGVDALHRAALGRLATILQAPGSEAVWRRAQDDQVIRTVLLLYDLLPRTEREQAEEALGSVVPYIESHGGKLALLRVEAGVVTVRLGGSCQGCAGSTVTLKRVVEGALRDGFAGFRELRVEDPPPPPKPPVPAPAPGVAAQLHGKRTLPVLAAAPTLAPTLRAPEWKDVAVLDDLPRDTLRGVQLDGTAVLLCNVGGDIFAYEDACPDSPLALSLGQLDGEAIVCPWHGCRFDARTGRRLVHRGVGLASFPVAVAEHVVRVAVNVPGPVPREPRPIAVSNRS